MTQIYMVECALVVAVGKWPRKFKWFVAAANEAEAIQGGVEALVSEVCPREGFSPDNHPSIHKAVSSDGVWKAEPMGKALKLQIKQKSTKRTQESLMTLRRQLSSLAMMSAIAMIGMNMPRYVPACDPPKPPGPPPLTPEQIKAQEKRARKAAKRAQQP